MGGWGGSLRISTTSHQGDPHPPVGWPGGAVRQRHWSRVGGGRLNLLSELNAFVAGGHGLGHKGVHGRYTRGRVSGFGAGVWRVRLAGTEPRVGGGKGETFVGGCGLTGTGRECMGLRELNLLRELNALVAGGRGLCHMGYIGYIESHRGYTGGQVQGRASGQGLWSGWEVSRGWAPGRGH